MNPEMSAEATRIEKSVASAGDSPSGGKASRREKSARSKEPADGDARPPAPTRKELDHQKRTERIRPHIEALNGADPKTFQQTLDGVIKEMKRASLKPPDQRLVLASAFKLMPPSLSGVVVAKHFKQGSDWNPAELVSAIGALRDAVEARAVEFEMIGPVVHGALICLVSGAKSLKQLGQYSSEDEDVVAALLSLHGALWLPERNPLRGLDEPPVKHFLSEAFDLLSLHRHRDEVGRIDGQRLFGFDVELRLSNSPRTAVSREVAGRPIERGRNDRERVSDQEHASVMPKSDRANRECEDRADSRPKETSSQRRRGAQEALARTEVQLTRAKEALDRVQQEREGFRSRIESLDAEVASLRRQLEASLALERELRQRAELVHGELEAEREKHASAREALASESERACESMRTAEQLRAELRQSQSENAVAKEFGYQQGRLAMKALIAAHSVGSLREIESAARSIVGGDGDFIRAMSASLARYMEE
jgi:hypothetical protein